MRRGVGLGMAYCGVSGGNAARRPDAAVGHAAADGDLRARHAGYAARIGPRRARGADLAVAEAFGHRDRRAHVAGYAARHARRPRAGLHSASVDRLADIQQAFAGHPARIHKVVAVAGGAGHRAAVDASLHGALGASHHAAHHGRRRFDHDGAAVGAVGQACRRISGNAARLRVGHRRAADARRAGAAAHGRCGAAHYAAEVEIVVVAATAHDAHPARKDAAAYLRARGVAGYGAHVHEARGLDADGARLVEPEVDELGRQLRRGSADVAEQPDVAGVVERVGGDAQIADAAVVAVDAAGKRVCQTADGHERESAEVEIGLDGKVALGVAFAGGHLPGHVGQLRRRGDAIGPGPRAGALRVDGVNSFSSCPI